LPFFDSKEVVTKKDIDSKIKSKLPLKEVRSLAFDARKLAFRK
jgi:hypothetical protein